MCPRCRPTPPAVVIPSLGLRIPGGTLVTPRLSHLDSFHPSTSEKPSPLNGQVPKPDACCLCSFVLETLPFAFWTNAFPGCRAVPWPLLLPLLWCGRVQGSRHCCSGSSSQVRLGPIFFHNYFFRHETSVRYPLSLIEPSFLSYSGSRFAFPFSNIKVSTLDIFLLKVQLRWPPRQM